MSVYSYLWRKKLKGECLTLSTYTSILTYRIRKSNIWTVKIHLEIIDFYEMSCTIYLDPLDALSEIDDFEAE